MIKQTNVIELLGQEKRLYHFYFHPKAPLGEVYDILGKMRNYVMEQMKLEEKRREESEKKV